VLPYFYWFAPVVYGVELFIGVSLILGVLVRGSAASRASSWRSICGPGSMSRRTNGHGPYFFLVVIQGFLTVHRAAGRSATT